MKKFCLLGLLLAVCLLCGLERKAEAAFNYEPVAFAVIDKTGNVSQADYLMWREQARQAYYVPYYEIIKDTKPEQVVVELLQNRGGKTSKLTTEFFQEVSAKIPAKVLVIVFVNQLEEYLVHGYGHRFEDMGETLQKVLVNADMYVYRADQEKMLLKKLRYLEVDEPPVSTPASEVLKWELRKLVNKMEGRQQI